MVYRRCNVPYVQVKRTRINEMSHTKQSLCVGTRVSYIRLSPLEPLWEDDILADDQTTVLPAIPAVVLIAWILLCYVR